MAKKKDYTFLAIIAAAGAYLVYDTFIKPQSTQAVIDPSTAHSNTPVLTLPVNTSGYPVRYNQYNADVKQLQAIVGTTQDGIIGPITLAAIQTWLPWFNQSFVINSYADLIQLGNDFIDARYNG